MYWNELTTGIYPWDVADEGIDTICHNLKHEAGCNAAYLIALMHHEKRPLYDNHYHHNPVRKQYVAEDSRAYWHWDESFYKGLRMRPRGSDREFLKHTDWLDVFTEGLRKHGLKPGVEISHTPIDRQRMLSEFRDCCQVDVFGEPIYRGERLCWNSPDARAFLEAIARELVTRYDVETLQTCSYLFSNGEPQLHPLLGICLGGCFCENCATQAKRDGLDWQAIKQRVEYFANMLRVTSIEIKEDFLLMQRGDTSAAMWLLEEPLLYQWLRFRCDSNTRFFKSLSEAVHDANPKVDLRFNTCYTNAEAPGLDLKAVGPYLDSIRLMDYAEQFGDRERVLYKDKWLANVRRQVGREKTIIGAVAARGKATPELIKLGIKTVALGGADGLSFGFYDGATIERLRAIKQGMTEAEVQLRVPPADK